MILVAGGSGLIGKTICNHLEKEHFSLSNYDLVPNRIVNWVDAALPLSKYNLSGFSRFIDCARYEKQEDQLATWRTVIEHFKQHKGGRIILFSSIYGHKAPDFSIYDGTEIKETPLEYAFTKGGIEQAVRYLAQQLKIDNIQVNCIAPGGVLNSHSQEFQRNYKTSGGTPMIETRDILPVVDMLLHPNNAVNGQVITVDAGWSL